MIFIGVLNVLYASEINDFRIMECFRAMLGSHSIQERSRELLPISPVFEHCYVVFAKGHQVVDSRGFYDTGPQRESKVDFAKCYAVKNYGQSEVEARSDWVKFLLHFDDNSIQYSLAQNNCCTRCVDVFRAIGFNMPPKCEEVNLGIGTRFKASGSAVDNLG
ncbi:MAG: hypothetical protein H6850_00680 [Alphaproteobacteria bacterium]|nr:MAG: hypothetical protein H6850_00680 [Alphaproteobacteria bacterium]